MQTDRSVSTAYEHYREGYEFKTIDETGITVYRQDRTGFLIEEEVADGV